MQFDFPDKNGNPYKSSGGEMVFNEQLNREIPASWKCSNLLELGVYNSDYTANGSFAGLAENVKYNEGEKYALLIRVVDFNDDFNTPENFVYINKHGYDYLNTCHLHGGEVVVCNVGNAGATFRCPFLKQKMALGPNGIVVNSDDWNDYLYMFYSSEMGQKQIKGISSGSIQLKFNKTSFRNMPIPIPPITLIKQFNKQYDTVYQCITNNWIESKVLIRQRNELLPLLMNGQINFDLSAQNWYIIWRYKSCQHEGTTN